MIILGTDTETTGLEEHDRVIELGAVLWDTDSRKPIAMMNELIHWGDSYEIAPDAYQAHGLNHEMLYEWGATPKFVFERFLHMASKADKVMAHNAPFDHRMLKNSLYRGGMNDGDTLSPKRWINTDTDVPYHKKITTRKLDYLACEHGFLNPFSHRALFDVLTMLKVVSRYPIETIVKLSESPTFECVADVSYEDRVKAKDLSFRWDAEKRKWIKRVKGIYLKELHENCAKAGFQIVSREVDPYA